MNKLENIPPKLSAGRGKKNVHSAAVIALLAVAFFAYFAASLLSGAAVFGFLLFYAAFAVLVFLPGMFLAQKLLKDMPLIEKCIISLPLGMLVLMFGFVGFGSFGLVYLSCVPSLVFCLLFISENIKRKQDTFLLKDMFRNNRMFFAVFAFVLGLFVFAGIFPMAKPMQANNMLYSQDLLWSISNAGSVRYGFPVVDMRVAGGVLHYHYFADVNNGLLALFSGQSAWDVVCYYSWPMWAFALFSGMYILAKRLGAGKNIALISASGVFVFSFLDVSNPVHIFRNPNNVVQSYTMLLACFLILLHMQKQKFKRFAPAAALVLVLFALAWSKTVLAVLFLCALFAAFVVQGAINKKPKLILAAVILVSAVMIAFLYGTIFSKAIINMEPAFSMAKIKGAFVFLITQAGPVFLIYLLSLVQSFKDFKKLGLVELVCNAMIIGGIMAFCLFSHYSRSENYFIFAAVFLMWICAAKILPFISDKKRGRAAVALCCVVAFVGNMFVLAPLLRHGVQTALRAANLRPDFEISAAAISEDDQLAAQWLNQNMEEEGEVFATNRNAQDAQAGEGVFHYYTAASQRQAFVESWRYAMDYSIDYHLLRHNLEQVSDGIFACDTFEEAAKIGRENGIDYLLLHLPTQGSKGFEGGAPVFVSETVLIYKVS